jgi:hypothetical protein
MEIKCGSCFPSPCSKADFCGANSFAAHIRNVHNVQIAFLPIWENWRCNDCRFDRPGKRHIFKSDTALAQHLQAVHGLNIVDIDTNPPVEREETLPTLSLQERRDIELRSLKYQLTQVQHSKMFVLWAAPFVVHVHPDFIYDDKPAQMLQQVLIRLDPDIVQLIMEYAWDAQRTRTMLKDLEYAWDAQRTRTMLKDIVV